MIQSIVLNGRKVNYNLERKLVKNLNLRIKVDGSVWVSANDRVEIQVIEEFLLEKAEFILASLGRYEEQRQLLPSSKQYIDGETFAVLGHEMRLRVVKGKIGVSSDGSYITLSVRDPADRDKKEKILTKWLHGIYENTVRSLCENVYPKFRKYGVEFPTIRFRNMVSRWGSCQPKRKLLTFNYALLGAPVSCIEYVVIHEFTHFLYPNHSKQFYLQLSMFMPDWRERKAMLENQYGLISE